jgi:hypothetical protein
MAATKQCADKAEMKRLKLHLAIEPVKKNKKYNHETSTSYNK